jgi:hypothetical protein
MWKLSNRMSGTSDDQDFTLAGHGETESEYDNNIYIPTDVLLNPGLIRDNDDTIAWHYATITGYAVIANNRLEKSYEPEKKYTYVDSRAVEPIGNDDNPTSYRVTVPKPFFEDYESQTKVDDSVPKHAQFEYDKSYYFIYRDDMAEGPIRSCFLLDSTEFSKVIPEGVGGRLTEEARERADVDEDQITDLTDTPRFF